MKIPEEIKMSIRCILAMQGEFPVRTRQMRLEVNHWREIRGKKPLGWRYFSWVVKQLEADGVIKCVRGTAMFHWDDSKWWVAA